MEKARGRGLGGGLGRALLGALRDAGAPGAFLQMHESNAGARRFYERLGFSQLTVSGAACSGGAFFMGVEF